MFDRIYPDANSLLAAGWPRLSTDLRNTAELARVLEKALVLAEVVQRELEHHWLRQFDSEVATLTTNARQLESRLSTIGLPADSPLTLPERQRVLEQYRQHVDEVIRQCGFQSIPAPNPPTQQLIDMSLRRHPPFKEKDTGLRDTLILLSILDDLHRAGGQTGALVSRDKIFRAPEIAEMIRAAGVQLEIYDDLKAIYAALEAHLLGVVRELYELHRKLVTMQLEERLPEIERFISETLEIPPIEIGVFLGITSVSVDAIRVRQLRSVRTPGFLEHRPGEVINFAFDLDVDIHATVEMYPSAPQTALKAGQTVVPSLAALGTVLQGPIRQGTVYNRSVEVEATARVTDQKTYEDVRFVKARLIPQSLLSSLLVQPGPGEARAERAS